MSVNAPPLAAMPALLGLHRSGPSRPGRVRPAVTRIASCILGLAAANASSAAGAQRTLEYRFAPGAYREYGRTVTRVPVGGGAPLVTRETIRVWALARVGDETLILVAVARGADDPAGPASGLVLHIDSSGRRRIAPETLVLWPNLAPAFDALPELPLRVEPERRWDGPPDPLGLRWRCVAYGADPAQGGATRVEFLVEDTTCGAPLLPETRTGRYWFDPARGGLLVLDAEADDGRGTRTRVRVELVRVARETANWAARRAEEAARFLRTLRSEARLRDTLVQTPAASERTLTELERLWSAFVSDVEEGRSPFVDVAENRRRELRAGAARWRSRAALAERWLGKRAPAWSLQDAAGRTVTSETLRTGVVLEYFWSAGTRLGWLGLDDLRRALPNLREPPVPVLCYEMDLDAGRAAAAVAACGHGLTHLLGAPLQFVDPVPDEPVLRLLDRDGRVTAVWVGWPLDFASACEAARAAAGAPTAAQR